MPAPIVKTLTPLETAVLFLCRWESLKAYEEFQLIEYLRPQQCQEGLKFSYHRLSKVPGRASFVVYEHNPLLS